MMMLAPSQHLAGDRAGSPSSFASSSIMRQHQHTASASSSRASTSTSTTATTVSPALHGSSAESSSSAQHNEPGMPSSPLSLDSAGSGADDSYADQSGEVVTGPDGEMIVVEHVVALHDFESNNPTCLSFQAGQVIRVFNRDASGWWDGEIDGERGWFPSNYVDQEAGSSSIGGHTASSVGDDHEEAARSGGSGAYNKAQRLSQARSQQIASSYSILDPIHHAIALLHNAVRANRVAHFQPSTACVISSVRSVLSATECLTRESPVLQAHPQLARERKQILSVLSRLVTQARKASAPMVDEGRRGAEMESMLRHAEMVLANVKGFLDVAVESGVEVPERRASVYDDLYSSEGGTGREQGNTPTPGSVGRHDPHGTASALAARSMLNLRIKTRSNSSAGGPQAMDNTPSSASSDAGSQDRVTASDSNGSMDSGASGSEASGSPSRAVRVTVERNATEVLARLGLANDQLLSVIAAFIGHVHTHTRESHASSYAHLIDMTRETVDAVRAVLVVVEAVHTDPYLQSVKTREMDVLFETRESLYEATTALVAAARVITGLPNAQARHAEEEEKSGLLQAATAVLRTAGECVGAVKLCVDRHDPSIRIRLSELVGAEKLRQEEEEAAEDLAGDRYATIRQHKNSLGALDRKASNLEALRDQYDANDRGRNDVRISSDSQRQSPALQQTARFASTSPTDFGRSGQTAPRLAVDHPGRPRVPSSASTRPRIGLLGRQESTSSDQHSDHTEQLMARQLSHTAPSSTRPSMDRRDTDVLNLDVPQTAPVGLRFTRDLPAGAGLRVPDGAFRGSLSEASSPLTENAPLIEQPAWMGNSFAPSDIALNQEKQIIGGTLPALVEKLTPHDTTVDATFSQTFATCFRMFTTPTELVDAMFDRYHLAPPSDVELSDEERQMWEQRKALPVRLRVINFLKNWLEFHYQPSTDAVVVDKIISFATAQEQPALQRAAMRLKELARRRSSAGSATKVQMMITSARRGSAAGTLTRVVSADQAKMDGTLGPLMELSNMYSPSAFSKSGPSPPAPIISKTLIAHLRVQPASNVIVTDFDPLELARQITVMESKLYCAILPEELLGQEFSKKAGVSNAVHVKGMSSLSTHLTGWISECILGEEDPKKRRDLLKFFIKLGDRCFILNNFNALMAIQCALNSSTITRLTKTWDGLGTKYKLMVEQQHRAVEHTRNFAEYRQRLRQTQPPALPFVGLFLTDLTFCHDGNAPTRASPLDPSKKLINFDRYVKVSRIINEVRKYQVPYDLVEVHEIQNYLRSVLSAVKGGGGGSAAEELYRRSLMLEPRKEDNAPPPPTPTSALVGAFNWKIGGGMM